MRMTSETRALAVMVFGAVVIGCAPILVRLAEAGPSMAAFWRTIIALPVLAAVSMRNGGPGRPSWLPALAGVVFALDLCMWHYGIAFTSVTNATVLANLTPVTVTVLSFLFLKERPGWTFLAALALAVVGAWLLAIGHGSSAPGRNPALGNVLSVMTTVFYAIYLMTVRAARRAASASSVMLWSTLTAAPVMLAGGLLLHERLMPTSPSGWLACVGLGGVHIFGQSAFAWALGQLPASRASVVALLQPVVAAILGWSIFGEMLGPVQGLGAAMALGGVVLAQLRKRPVIVQAPVST